MLGTDMVSVRTADLRQIRVLVARLRKRVYADARLHRDDKVYFYSQCKALDEIVDRYLQLELFSPAQREG